MNGAAGKEKKSPFFDVEEVDPVKGGVAGYRRDQIYRYLFDNTDRSGIIVYTIVDLADAAQVDRHRFGYIYKEFVEMGLLEKVDGRHYRCLVNPDEYDWGESFLEESKRIRKQFQHYYKQKAKKEKE